MKPGPKPRESKICPACKIDKPRGDYYKKGTGIAHLCKPCSLADNKTRASKYFGKYAEYQNEWRRDKYQNDPAYKQKTVSLKKERYDKLRDSLNQKRRERWAIDPFDPARKYFRRKDVKDRTPLWVDLEAILAIYAACPEGHEVDHIAPLKDIIDGRPVSGLHVPWNLQYLTTEANRKKHCRITEADITALR